LTSRALRGGSWFYYDPDFFRAAFRCGFDPDFWSYYFGFRIALRLQGGPDL